jgi:hypothetical protein
LQIVAREQQTFCSLNLRAHGAFTTAISRFEAASTVSRETDLGNIPTSAAVQSGGQDAVVADVLWGEVRNEIEFQNESAEKVRLWHQQGDYVLYKPTLNR